MRARAPDEVPKLYPWALVKRMTDPRKLVLARVVVSSTTFYPATRDEF